MNDTPVRIPDDVDTLLLDLDGTLLDLAYDTHFWLELVPAHYGAARGLTPDEARAVILPRMKAWEGQLAWYSLDAWSEALGMDLAALKRRFPERIGWLPGARDFLERQRAIGRRLVLATNSHPVALAIKDGQTDLSRYLDAVYSSHEFGVPKEDARFWPRFRGREPYDPERAAFIDDNPSVLRAARASGIRHVIAITDPDSSRPPRDPDPAFPGVPGVAML